MAGFDVAAIQQRLHPQRVRWTVSYHAACDSTQDLARAALRQGAGEGATFVAGWQRAGRGRHGRSWTAPPELALLFSVILTPPSALVGILPLLAGVAVAEAIESSAGIECELKWPNDVLAQGGKLAGILAERADGPAVVIGVGVNANLRRGDLPDPAATSLLVVTGKEVSREDLLVSILTALDLWYGRGLVQSGSAVLEEWRRRTTMLGEPVEVILGGRSRKGTAEELDGSGRLIVRFEDGEREPLVAGDVQRITRTSSRSAGQTRPRAYPWDRDA